MSGKSEWMTVPDAVAKYRVTEVRMLNWIGQGTIRTVGENGFTKVHTDDIERILANDPKPTVANERGARATVNPADRLWTRADDRALIDNWWSMTHEEIGALVGRSAEAVNSRARKLTRSKRLPKSPRGHMSIPAAHKRYGVPETAIQVAARGGAIGAIRRGSVRGKWWVNRDDVAAMAEGRPVAASTPGPVPDVQDIVETAPPGYIPTAAAATISGKTQDVVQTCAREGKIPAVKVRMAQGCGGRGYAWAVLEDAVVKKWGRLDGMVRQALPPTEPRSPPEAVADARVAALRIEIAGIMEDRDRLNAQVLDQGKRIAESQDTIRALRDNIIELEAKAASTTRSLKTAEKDTKEYQRIARAEQTRANEAVRHVTELRALLAAKDETDAARRAATVEPRPAGLFGFFRGLRA